MALQLSTFSDRQIDAVSVGVSLAGASSTGEANHAPPKAVDRECQRETSTASRAPEPQQQFTTSMDTLNNSNAPAGGPQCLQSTSTAVAAGQPDVISTEAAAAAALLDVARPSTASYSNSSSGGGSDSTSSSSSSSSSNSGDPTPPVTLDPTPAAAADTAAADVSDTNVTSPANKAAAADDLAAGPRQQHPPQADASTPQQNPKDSSSSSSSSTGSRRRRTRPPRPARHHQGLHVVLDGLSLLFTTASLALAAVLCALCLQYPNLAWVGVVLLGFTIAAPVAVGGIILARNHWLVVVLRYCLSVAALQRDTGLSFAAVRWPPLRALLGWVLSGVLGVVGLVVAVYLSACYVVSGDWGRGGDGMSRACEGETRGR